MFCTRCEHEIAFILICRTVSGTQLAQNSLNIATDALLFTVEARPVLSDGTFGDFEKIGEILQGADSWVESLWGDERLFFAH